MKKTTFTTIIVLLCLCFSCSKDNDSSGAGALGVTGSGIYYKFAGGYGYYDLRSGRNITEIFKSNIVDKYDVSWDGQKLLVAWAKRPYGQYQTDYLQFTYLPMLEKKSGAATSDDDFEKRKINSFDFNSYDIGGSEDGWTAWDIYLEKNTLRMSGSLLRPADNLPQLPIIPSQKNTIETYALRDRKSVV